MAIALVTTHIYSMISFDAVHQDGNDKSLTFKLAFAIVAAAAAIVALVHVLGIVLLTFSSQQEPDGTAYSWHAVKQDLRCIVSFTFGVVSCCMLSLGREDDEECDEEEEIQNIMTEFKFAFKLFAHFM